MGTIYYGCQNCEDHNPEGACYRREDLRLMPGGEWICQNCYEDAPYWTYNQMPEDTDAEEPRWHDMPDIPEYVPAKAAPSVPLASVTTQHQTSAAEVQLRQTND